MNPNPSGAQKNQNEATESGGLILSYTFYTQRLTFLANLIYSNLAFDSIKIVRNVGAIVTANANTSNNSIKRLRTNTRNLLETKLLNLNENDGNINYC